MSEPTLADAICDRIVHDSYIIVIQGDSMKEIRHYRIVPCRPGLPRPAQTVQCYKPCAQRLAATMHNLSGMHAQC
ncbi:ATP-binding protein [Sporomusa termitida]|uniref:ATP-binding protein n=1 Tax=Sporomusa termitida TaxID=2377 RepID=UPI001FE73E14|nr:ATP-binding protein [Sporomusa termitida]